MATKKLKKRGGWPARRRSSVILRMDPDRLEWFTSRSADAGCSRNALMEGLLSAVADTLLRVEDEYAASVHGAPRDALAAFGRLFVGEAISLGLLKSLVVDAAAAGDTEIESRVRGRSR